MESSKSRKNLSIKTFDPTIAEYFWGLLNVDMYHIVLSTFVFGKVQFCFKIFLLKQTLNNIAIGDQALSSDTKGSANTAIGRAALFSQNFTSATSSYNTGVGYGAGSTITTGIRNTLVGGLAGDALTDADFNLALG